MVTSIFVDPTALAINDAAEEHDDQLSVYASLRVGFLDLLTSPPLPQPLPLPT